MILLSVLGFLIGISKHWLEILLSCIGQAIGLLFAPMVDFEVAAFANLARVHLPVPVFAVGRLLDASKPVVAVCTQTF